MHALPPRPPHLACRAQNIPNSKWKPKKKAKASLPGFNSVPTPPNILPTTDGDLQMSHPFIHAIQSEELSDAISGADTEGEVWMEEDVVSAFRYIS
jgi:hypothetical protein